MNLVLTLLRTPKYGMSAHAAGLCKPTFLTTEDPQKRKKPRITWA